MRRISVFLAGAVILLTFVVAYTYKLSVDRHRRHHAMPVPQIAKKYKGEALRGWEWNSDDPQTNKPVVRATAKSFHATDSPSTFDIRGLALRLYDKKAASYTFVKSDQALFDEGSEMLKSEGPVTIVMNVPADKDAEDKAELANVFGLRRPALPTRPRPGRRPPISPPPSSFRMAAVKPSEWNTILPENAASEIRDCAGLGR